MIDPSIVIILAKARRELTRLLALGLLITYGLAALAACGAGNCNAGLQAAIVATLEHARPFLWQGIALAFLLEFTGGLFFMTIGLAIDWWKDRHAKAAAAAEAAVAEAAQAAASEARAEARAEEEAAYRDREAVYRDREAAYRDREAAYREKLLRAGIDPDTGERLPHFNNGADNGNPSQ